MCFFSSGARLKDLLHVSHCQVNCLLSEWTNMWSFKTDARLKDILHMLQVNGLLLPWITMCNLKVHSRIKIFLHALQVNGLLSHARIQKVLSEGVQL